MFFDVTGTLASLLATYYFTRLKTQAWLISLIAVSMNGYLYWQQAIYGDMALEIFYFFAACYGWLTWQTSQKAKPIITRLVFSQWLKLGICFFFIYFIIWYLLTVKLHSNAAHLDAFTTSLSIIAQWMMGQKIIITWLLWFAADAAYAWLYWQKHLFFHTLLMMSYLMMALIGYHNWAKKA